MVADEEQFVMDGWVVKQRKVKGGGFRRSRTHNGGGAAYCKQQPPPGYLGWPATRQP